MSTDLSTQLMFVVLTFFLAGILDLAVRRSFLAMAALLESATEPAE